MSLARITTVPLSEREQKILQEIERDLFREDPTFARDVRRGRRWDEASRARLGAVLFVGGLIALLVFFASRRLPLGVASFGAMVAGVVMVAGSFRSLLSRRTPQAHQRPRQRLASALRSWEERIRQRYRK